MVNLLSDKPSRIPFSCLDPGQFGRLRERLKRLELAAAKPQILRQLDAEFATFEGPLEELETATSLASAEDLLDAFARRRVEITSDIDSLDASPTAGGFFCYWPGRSLSTGEAELASRGYFDVMDRPPLANWLEAIARPMASNHQVFEVAILVWVSESDLDRARSGRMACGTESLAMVAEASTALAEQLQPLLRGTARVR